MEDSPESGSSGLSRRAMLGALGVGVGVGLAGCTEGVLEGDSQSRIEALEAELAAVQSDKEALAAELETVAAERDMYRRRLETGNLWGFEPETMTQLQRVADRWRDSVVAIDAITPDGSWGMGTGWVYDEGIIVSNAHVIQPLRLPDDSDITQYTVWDREGASVEASLLGFTYGEDAVFDEREDIGFLSVPGSMTAGRQMEHGVSRDLGGDEPLVQIGHPYSLEFWTSSVGPFIRHREPFFSTNVPGQPGVSGSPVLDLDGAVVGMTWGGQYTRRQQRQPGEPPRVSDGEILPTFEKAMNGMHSYMHRVHTAAAALT